MPDSPHNWIGLEFTEDLDSEAFRLKIKREAKAELWWRGILAAAWLFLAISGYWRLEPEEDALLYVFWSGTAVLMFVLLLLRRSQLAKETVASKYVRKMCLQDIKLTVATEGDDGTIVGEPEVYYWAYANSFEVVEAGIEVTFKHGRKTKTILVPSAMFPDPRIMEEFRAYAKGEAARRGLQPKEHWLRPPG